jgi:hypothetical protein
MTNALTPKQALEAALYALNAVRRTKMNCCPHGIRDTYQLADALVMTLKKLKADETLSQ